MTARCAQRVSYQLFRKEKRGKKETEQLAPQWLHLLLSGVAAAKPLLRPNAAVKCSVLFGFSLPQRLRCEVAAS